MDAGTLAETRAEIAEIESATEVGTKIESVIETVEIGVGKVRVARAVRGAVVGNVMSDATRVAAQKRQRLL